MLNWFRKKRTEEPGKVVVTVTEPLAQDVPSELSREASSDGLTTERGEPIVVEATEQQEVEIPRDKIAARAYEIWVRRGQQPGSSVQDWLDAEAELRAEYQDHHPEPLPTQPR